jgi:hypothetical protein
VGMKSTSSELVGAHCWVSGKGSGGDVDLKVEALLGRKGQWWRNRGGFARICGTRKEERWIRAREEGEWIMEWSMKEGEAGEDKPDLGGDVGEARWGGRRWDPAGEADVTTRPGKYRTTA